MVILNDLMVMHINVDQDLLVGGDLVCIRVCARKNN